MSENINKAWEMWSSARPATDIGCMYLGKKAFKAGYEAGRASSDRAAVITECTRQLDNAIGMKLSDELRGHSVYVGRVQMNEWADRIAELEQERDALLQEVERLREKKQYLEFHHERAETAIGVAKLAILNNDVSKAKDWLDKFCREMDEYQNKALRQTGGQGGEG